MNIDEKEDTRIYKVVVNHEEQYSIWPADRENPLGWNDAGKSGLKAECLAYIKEVWTDMRPLSLRKRMEEQARAAAARSNGKAAETNGAEAAAVKGETAIVEEEAAVVEEMADASAEPAQPVESKSDNGSDGVPAEPVQESAATPEAEGATV